MESPQIYTALNVPTVTSHPSVKCLQWSADGQACFATKTSVYIMTPDHGIHFDTTSAIRSLNEKDTRDGVLPIGWFRTIISFDKMEVHRWPEYSQAWGAASLGSIDVSLWDIALSPSALSPDSGCILAALSSNMDFTLWTASKNCLKGEWIKIFDVTPFLLETYLVDGETLAEKTVRTLKAQVTSIFWSSQVDYSMIPAPTIDGSLLIAGNRAGSIIFLRYRADQTMQIVESLQVAEQWITWITFSSWTLVKPGTCEGFLSYGTSDGSVGLVKVTQSFPDSSDSWDNLQSGLLPTITFDSSIGIICRPDRAGITALTWAEIPHKGRVLVYCKPGVVYIWCPASPNFAWSGHRSFPLKTLKLSTGSSSLHPVSGIQYIRRMDILIITISDGSFHVVHNVTIDPSMEPPNTEQLVTSERLSTAVRAVFTQSGQDVDFSDVNRITGIMPYDGCATFIWIQEASRPADFSYKHDAKHSSMVVVSRTWDDTNNEALLQDLAEVLEGAKIGFTPLHLLRPFFFTLRDKKRLSDLHVPFLEILKPRTADYSTNITVAPWDSATPESRRAFRASLVQNLFGWDDLLSLRMRLSLADFAWKHSDNEERQNECGNVAQLLLNTISHCVLRTIIRHLAAAVNILTPNDIPFVLRMVVQSLLPGSPADLSAEGNNLSTASQAIVFPHPQITPIANSFNERCPACQVEVPLQDITTAVCSNGHTWARCSITTFILSTPLLRTCVGCSRKAFLPLSTPNSTTRNWLPAAAQGWVVEELLEAVHRCLFCSNSFVNVL